MTVLGVVVGQCLGQCHQYLGLAVPANDRRRALREAHPPRTAQPHRCQLVPASPALGRIVGSTSGGSGGGPCRRFVGAAFGGFARHRVAGAGVEAAAEAGLRRARVAVLLLAVLLLARVLRRRRPKARPRGLSAEECPEDELKSRSAPGQSAWSVRGARRAPPRSSRACSRGRL